MQHGNIIELTDGTKLEIKISFATLYFLQKNGATKKGLKIQEQQKNNEEITEDESMDFAAEVIYAILRSNGRKVDFEEALELVYPDTESIETILSSYSNEMEKLKKKEESKIRTKEFTKKKKKKKSQKKSGQNS